MTDSSCKELVVLISHGANHDKATVGFTLANAALATGMRVAVFLASDGVDLSRERAGELAHVRPFKPIADLIEEFVRKGGIVWASSPCRENRGVRAGEHLPGVIVTGPGPLLEWVAGGASTLCL
jgi:predicted peroxiredoxin